MAQIGDYQGLCAEYEEDIEEKNKEIEQLKKDLKVYGRHIVGECKLLIHSKYGCTCGLYQALKGE